MEHNRRRQGLDSDIPGLNRLRSGDSLILRVLSMISVMTKEDTSSKTLTSVAHQCI